MNTANSSTSEQVIKEMQLQNYSPGTIQSYAACLTSLGNYTDIPLDKISIPTFKEFLYHRITIDKVSVPMVNQSISAYKILQESVLGLEWTPLNIKRPRRNKKLPIVLSMQEVSNMITVTSNLKHRTLIALAYSSGVRREEMRNLKPSEIDSDRMRIHVKEGKGKKDRYTILSQKALDLLRIYYKAERPKTFLFEPINKKGIHYGAETINKIVKIAASTPPRFIRIWQM